MRNTGSRDGGHAVANQNAAPGEMGSVPTAITSPWPQESAESATAKRGSERGS